MFYLFADETNRDASADTQFFIYGGLFLPSSGLIQLHQLVSEIRDRHGFSPTDPFKFAPFTRPKQVQVASFKAAKKELLLGIGDLGARFCASLTLHQIAKTRQPAELVAWGANTVLGAFNEFLTERSEHGAAIFDAFPFKDSFAFLREKFQTGISWSTGETRKLDRVLLGAVSCEGASHAMSAVDIVLGSFRYCVNERGKTEAPKQIMSALARLLWHARVGKRVYLSERGLRYRPKRVLVASYRAECESLTSHLAGLIEAGSA